jgi:hypothetical protein
MTATVDPGRSTKQIPPHPGDAHAQHIRAALDRLKGLPPEHQAAKQRTDDEQAALEAAGRG